MIRIERVSAEQVKERVNEHPELVDMSFENWAVYVNEKLTVYLGAVRHSPLGAARIWLIPVDEEVMKTWAFRRAMRLITTEGKKRFGSLMAGASCGRDQRFAEFCGLRLVGEIGQLVRLEI